VDGEKNVRLSHMHMYSKTRVWLQIVVGLGLCTKIRVGLGVHHWSWGLSTQKRTVIVAGTEFEKFVQMVTSFLNLA